MMHESAAKIGKMHEKKTFRVKKMSKTSDTTLFAALYAAFYLPLRATPVTVFFVFRHGVRCDFF
jgi:hypothetical protein